MLSNARLSMLLDSTKEDHLQRNAYALQCKRFEIFKSQDLAKGRFDVTFDFNGKTLNAHAFLLTTVSETFDIMLSERWSKNNSTVKIESYSYESFYEFLCFVYSGTCKLTSENIFEMVDIAEFYALPSLKNLCDTFLSNMALINVATVQELTEFARKYSLEKLGSSVNQYICSNITAIIKDENMVTFNKSFVEYLSMFNKLPREAFFEAVYKWAEHYVRIIKALVGDDTVDVHKAIKSEMSIVLSQTKLYKMDFDFLMNFVLEKGFMLSSYEMAKFYLQSRKVSKDEEYLFIIAYELAEKQGLQKQKMASDGEIFNLEESIKADLSDVLTFVRFYKMGFNFLMDFVVGKGILSVEEAYHVCDTCVHIHNGQQVISGIFKDDIGLRQAMKLRTDRSYETKQGSITKIRYKYLKFPIPSIPSTVMKMKGVDWYLCLESTGILAFKHHSKVKTGDYLIAEMKSATEFRLNPEQSTTLTAFYNNI